MTKQVFLRCFEVIFVLVMGVVTVLSITGTKRNIEWQNQLFVTAVMLLVMIAGYMILHRMERFLVRHGNGMFTLFMILWAVGLYGFCYVFHNYPSHDYETVMQAVTAYISGETVDWSYFALFKNNFMLFAILLGLHKVALFFGMTDAFPVMLIFSVLIVVWAGYCIFKLLKNTGHAPATCFFGLFLFAGFMPLWGGTYNLYTDCVSLCFGIWACYLLCLAKNRKCKWLYYLGAGLVWGMGYGIKTTVAVSLVAVLFVMLFTVPYQKTAKIFCLAAVGFVLSTVLVESLWMQFPCAEMEEEYAAPFAYWFAIGLCGDGSDPGNAEFAVRCLETPGIEGKKQVAMEHIRANISELWNPDHLVLKARYNFASGHMGLPDFNRYNVNVMYEIFNDYGDYGGYAIMYSSGYLYAIYVFGILGSVMAVLDGRHKKQTDSLGVVGRMTIFGLVVFLMLFEANNRQLYNHMPMFALMGTLGCERIGQFICYKVRKCKNGNTREVGSV